MSMRICTIKEIIAYPQDSVCSDFEVQFMIDFISGILGGLIPHIVTAKWYTGSRYIEIEMGCVKRDRLYCRGYN
jgi:hypothetical protein